MDPSRHFREVLWPGLVSSCTEASGMEALALDDFVDAICMSQLALQLRHKHTTPSL